jgi:CRP-like cAMP-binding protein
MTTMNSQLINTIQSIYYLEENILKILLEKIEIFEFPARFKLIKTGLAVNKIFFIEKGASRSYYLKDGKEITTWFAFENEFITSFYSFISMEPSNETIELLEDSIIWELKFNDLNRLTVEYPAINHLYRKVLELNFVRQEKLLNERFSTAKEKYENLITKYPHILQRVPLGYIASYLGITQSTLSRIRHKIS